LHCGKEPVNESNANMKTHLWILSEERGVNVKEKKTPVQNMSFPPQEYN
jgi:hypothetical protein